MSQALVLLGTGPAGGLPVAGCACRVCRRLAAAGVSRRPAAAVTGGTWLKAVPGVRLLGDVLWAPVVGLLGADDVAALAGASATQVVLGPAPGRAVAEAALSLARLRGVGAVADGADVVLVGLTDRHPPPEPRLLAAWGMRLAADGSRLGAAAVAPALPPRTLILGGSSSGKSALAEDLLAAWPSVTYLATGPAPAESDGEWAERVRAHRERRPPWWRTVETADVAGVLGATPEPVLLDAVGTWLTGVLDRAGAWDGSAGWRASVDGQVAALVDAWRARAGVAVAVSDEVGWGVVPETPAGRLFRAELGRLNRLLAAESEQVLLVVAGRVVELPDGVG